MIFFFSSYFSCCYQLSSLLFRYQLSFTGLCMESSPNPTALHFPLNSRACSRVGAADRKYRTFFFFFVFFSVSCTVRNLCQWNHFAITSCFCSFKARLSEFSWLRAARLTHVKPFWSVFVISPLGAGGGGLCWCLSVDCNSNSTPAVSADIYTDINQKGLNRRVGFFF